MTTLSQSIHVRDATTSDVSIMARLHRLSYSRGHFLALLSESVLADYYGRFLGHGSHIVVAVGGTSPNGLSSADESLGFAVFGRNIEPRIASFKRDYRWNILGTALRHPVLAARKMLTAAKRRLRTTAPHDSAPSLLLSIVVRDAGKGVGRVLLEDMLRRSAAAGEERIGLYVRHNNVAAINAYLRVGFVIVTSITDQYYMERTLVPESNMRKRNARRSQ